MCGAVMCALREMVSTCIGTLNIIITGAMEITLVFKSHFKNILGV